MPTPKPTPSAILSLVLRPEKIPPLLVLVGGEEVVIVELGVEVVETVPCCVVAAPTAVGEPVATPAIIEATILEVLVGCGSVAGASQVNIIPGILFEIYK